MKRILAMVLAAMLLVGCCSVFGALADEAPEGYPEVVPGIDFGGMDVYIYDYYTNKEWRDKEDEERSEQEQAQWDYRCWIESTYNVHIHDIAKGDWGTCAQEMINFNAAPESDKLALFIVEPGKVGSLVNNGMCASWSDQTLVDMSKPKWNKFDLDLTTANGKIYGVFPQEFSEPRQCLYFNKRVLEEAGIDWETIYDMQANGTWTWEAFEEILAKVQKDKDNDGTIDIWGLIGSADDMYLATVWGNDGKFFDKDENGKLIPVANSDNTIEALNWAKRIIAEYMMPQPEGANWDWFKSVWMQGNVAFYSYQTYGGFNPPGQNEMESMEDEWGAVGFPVGPKGTHGIMQIASDNITMIPSVYATDKFPEDTVAKLVFIYDLWTNPTPGYEDDDNWVAEHSHFTSDDRCIEETYATLRLPEHTGINLGLALGTTNDIMGEPVFWQISWNDPSAIIEAAMPTWQALCAIFNGDMTREEYDKMVEEQKAEEAASTEEATAEEAAAEEVPAE